MTREAIQTALAPEAIGCYSQAINTGRTVYLSGQIALDPESMLLVSGDIREQVIRVFENMKTVAEAAGGHLNAMVKLTVYLTDMTHLGIVNEIMPRYFAQPYPARTSIAVKALPKEALVEIEAIMIL